MSEDDKEIRFTTRMPKKKKKIINKACRILAAAQDRNISFNTFLVDVGFEAALKVIAAADAKKSKKEVAA